MVAFAMTLGSNAAAIRILVGSLISCAGADAVVSLTLILAAFCDQLDMTHGVISAIVLAVLTACGLCSGFYVSIDNAPIFVSWLFYISPLFYVFSSNVRVMMSGLSVTCTNQLIASAAECYVLSPDGYLNEHGYANVNVGLSGVMLIVFNYAYFAIFQVVLAMPVRSYLTKVASFFQWPSSKTGLHRVAAVDYRYVTTANEAVGKICATDNPFDEPLPADDTSPRLGEIIDCKASDILPSHSSSAVGADDTRYVTFVVSTQQSDKGDGVLQSESRMQELHRRSARRSLRLHGVEGGSRHYEAEPDHE
jgi:hypothetical protein